jgi:hypothetical protein
MKNQRQAQTDEQAALERERDRISKMNQRQAETEEQLVQQWHISYLVMMGQDLYSHTTFQIY